MTDMDKMMIEKVAQAIFDDARKWVRVNAIGRVEALRRMLDEAVCAVYGHGAPRGPWTCPKCGKRFALDRLSPDLEEPK